MNRRDIFKEDADMDQHRAFMANAKETCAEDNAFMARMKTKPFRDWNSAEQQRLWRIAKRGLDVRRSIYRSINELQTEYNEREENGTLNHGFKLGYFINKQLLHLKAIIK